MKSKSFRKNLITFLTGTAAAQAILVLISPILSRLFTPTEFGELSIYTSIFMVLSVLVTLRYEQAIIIAKSEQEAMQVLKICLIISFVLSISLMLLLYFFKSSFLAIMDISTGATWIWLIPISMLALGLYQSLNYWSTRRAQYKLLSRSLMFRSTSMSTVQILSGFLKLGNNGLIIGQVIGQVIASIVLFIQVLTIDKKVFFNSKLTLKTIKKTIISFKEFPIFNAPQGLIDTFSRNMIPFFFVAYYGTSIAGYYAMAAKMIQIPFDLIGNSIFQVFYPKITEDFNEGKDIFKNTKKIIFYMSLISVLFIAVIAIGGPWIFEIFLGANWGIAGEYGRWIIISFVASFVTKPVVAIIRLFKLQHLHLIFEILLLILRCSILVIGGQILSPVETLMYYSMTSLLFYGALIIFILTKIKKKGINIKI
ncbi:lipopolysaccharide biosynthesis protein [Terribacillus saccharophilus]|uniref:lipopolysaccharide biosynthesis protein n=1 Tax=Terribacillus saccharophilus TaxID=361277 RepID=UPI003823748C